MGEMKGMGVMMEEKVINGRAYYVCDVPEDVEVETVALGMIEQNEINGLLFCRLIQQDASRYFRYDAQQGTTLEAWLGKVRDKEEVIELTESILEVSEEIERYLMEEDHLCTQIPYLRVQGNRCSLAYIPLREYREGNVPQLVRQIWEKVDYARDEDYTYIFDLLNAFGRGEIRDAVELKKWIRMIRDGENPAEQSDWETPMPLREMIAGTDVPITSGSDYTEGREKKHHFFGSRKRKDEEQQEAALPVSLPPEQESRQGKVKYYNEIEDTEATVLVTPQETGYLIRINSGQEYLIENPVYVIGSGAQADICIENNSAVSRKHAQIGRDEAGGYYIKDLNSTNGTYVNGRQMAAGEMQPLEDVSRITLANEELKFEMRRR